MKIVKITLENDTRLALEKLQANSYGILRDRSLAVLHCADGKQIKWIAQALNRTPGTIGSWIKRFLNEGVSGLNREFSPGRPSKRNELLAPKLREYLQSSPRNFGWYEDVWTMNVIIAQFEKDLGRKFSQSSVTRLLKDEGYSFKRPRKSLPLAAPSKEEKLARIQQIANEIINLKEEEDVEVVYLDESHFSTEPYVIRGWHKKGQSFFPTDTEKKRKHFDIWSICTSKWEILLEKCEKK